MLRKDNWDDYGYRTTYLATYLDESGAAHFIGTVKILQNGEEVTDIPRDFSRLSENYCSLGQGYDYYRGLAAYGLQITNDLRDIAIHRNLIEEFKPFRGFKDSLLRSSEAERMLTDAFNYLSKHNHLDIDFRFEFTTDLPEASKPHKIDFDFSPFRLLPNRIFGLIGQNGTGKTQILNRLAKAITDIHSNAGTFNTATRPPFSRVIVLSYGAFDQFEIKSDTSSTSYFYCGLKDSFENISPGGINDKLQKSFERIFQERRDNTWRKVMREATSIEFFSPIVSRLDDVLEGTIQFADLKLSSGHSMTICAIADIIANIEPGSLILFDEPENHLHPTALSSLLVALYDVLSDKDSYMIIATHSPLVLQEIPARYVRIIERVGSVPIVRKPDIETFGNNLSTISDMVYGNISQTQLHQKHLINLAKHNELLEISESFEPGLSIGTISYLHALAIEGSRDA